MVRFNSTSDTFGYSKRLPSWVPPPPPFVIHPALRRIINRIATENPDIFGRLGPHYNAAFVIAPATLPFVLLLRNALDDVDDSIAENVADMFGRPGRAALKALRRTKHSNNARQENYR